MLSSFAKYSRNTLHGAAPKGVARRRPLVISARSCGTLLGVQVLEEVGGGNFTDIPDLVEDKVIEDDDGPASSWKEICLISVLGSPPRSSHAQRHFYFLIPAIELTLLQTLLGVGRRLYFGIARALHCDLLGSRSRARTGSVG